MKDEKETGEEEAEESKLNDDPQKEPNLEKEELKEDGYFYKGKFKPPEYS